MSAEFQISLPNWTPQRLIRESCAAWNLRHPDNCAGPDESPWPLLYNAVMSFLRHQQTHYEQALAAGADRDELHQRIARAAGRQYPWLRVEHDPRTNDDPKPERPAFRPFNAFSRQISDLVSERSQLSMAIRDARRKRAEGWRAQVAEMEARLARVNARAEQLNEFFKPSVEACADGVYISPLSCFHTAHRYDFGGRGALPESYTKSAGFKCPACGKTVCRTKCPIDHGSGKKLVAFSCYCASVSIETKYVAGIHLAHWTEMVGQWNQDTNIVVYDTQGLLLYGHRLLAEIAAGRKDEKDVKVFRGVILDAFLALLSIKFPEHECVRALRSLEELPLELFERISAELVLTVADLELLMESQERVASESS